LIAEEPFHFVTASYLTLILNQRATTLAELLTGIEQCSDGSIFFHTFRSLARHHFLTEGFSNDFAQWVLAACNRPELAEQLASVDIRDYVSLADLRNELRRIVAEFCDANPREAQGPAFEWFYFCETIEEQIAMGVEARTLEEFRAGLEKLSHASLEFHFITSRLRVHLRRSDFSIWLDEKMKMPQLARRVDAIDIYTNTLDSARSRILALVDREMAQ
jgi:Family of unknown function (DUF5752)